MEPILSICLFVCHAGPAEHFSTLSRFLKEKGHHVQIYATEPAIQKFDQENIHSFSKEDKISKIVSECRNAHIVITDVGDPFTISLQKTFSLYSPNTKRFAYYDNPESYVPGGYSSTAAKVIKEAEYILFSNVNLENSPLYEGKNQEMDLSGKTKIGIGYYPLEKIEVLKKRRKEEHEKLKQKFLRDQGLSNQNIFIYFGGNNQEYFEKAFPAFLSYLKETKQTDTIFILHQHPGAKEKNLDGVQVLEYQKLRTPLFISSFSLDEAFVLADAAFYYQTSMGPQFVLSGIETVHVGHELYEDVLVKNHLCQTATTSEEFFEILSNWKDKKPISFDKEKLYQALGIKDDWQDLLEQAMMSL